MTAKLIPLIALALLRFDPAPSMQILRRWCRDGRIHWAIRIGVRGDEWVKVRS